MANFTVPDYIKNDLLNLGILTMSLSPYPYEPMDRVINWTLTPPDGSLINTTFMKQLGSEMKSFGVEQDPFLALTVLKSLLISLEEPNSKASSWTKNAIWTAVSGFFVFLRILTKHFVTVGIKRDDIAMGIAWCLSCAMALISHFEFDKHRPCHHIWDVSWFEFTWNVRGVYYNQIMYISVTYVIKVAIMLFYWDLVPRNSTQRVFRVFHWCIIATFVFVTALAVTALFTIIFQCNPVPFWRDPLHAKCLPRVQLWTAASWLLFVSDLFVLALPIRVVWALNLKRREKAVVIALFALGSLACLAMIPRIISTQRFINDPDLTYKQCNSGEWVFIEACLAMIASCIPATKALVVRFAPRLIGVSRSAISKFSSKKSSQSGRSEHSTGLDEVELEKQRNGPQLYRDEEDGGDATSGRSTAERSMMVNASTAGSNTSTLVSNGSEIDSSALKSGGNTTTSTSMLDSVIEESTERRNRS